MPRAPKQMPKGWVQPAAAVEARDLASQTVTPEAPRSVSGGAVWDAIRSPEGLARVRAGYHDDILPELLEMAERHVPGVVFEIRERLAAIQKG